MVDVEPLSTCVRLKAGTQNRDLIGNMMIHQWMERVKKIEEKCVGICIYLHNLHNYIYIYIYIYIHIYNVSTIKA